MDKFINIVTSIFAAIPFSAASWFVLCTLGFFIWLFAKASKEKNNPIYWEHLIIDSQNDRASPYKVGYLVGIIVSTWIVIQFEDKDHLTFDILGTYLTFLLGGAGVNQFTKSKSTGPITLASKPGDDPDDADPVIGK
jgi:hypothetical protein